MGPKIWSPVWSLRYMRYMEEDKLEYAFPPPTHTKFIYLAKKYIVYLLGISKLISLK